MSKRLRVSEETQVHMTTEYRRNGRKKSSNSKPKRVYSFVIKGILIPLAMVSTVMTTSFGDGSVVEASNPQPLNTAPIIQSNHNVQDAMLSNLKMANKVLKASIATGQLSPQSYEKIVKSLSTLEVELAMQKDFIEINALLLELDRTDMVIKHPITTTDKDVMSKRALGIAVLDSVQELLNVPQKARRDAGIVTFVDGVADSITTVGVNQPVNGGNAYTPYVATSMSMVKGVSTSKPSTVKAKTPAKKVTAPAKKVATAKAKAPGKKVTAPAKKSEVKSASKVKDVNTINGIKTRHGDTYGVKNQKEYDAVMQKVDEVIKANKDKVEPFEGRMDIYQAYKDGARFNGDRSDRSEYNRGLFTINSVVEPLLDSGLSFKQIEDILVATKLGYKAIGGSDFDGTGNASSAYDSVISKIRDCDSGAQGVAAVLQQLGYKTKITRTVSHASIEVSINGKWYAVGNGNILTID